MKKYIWISIIFAAAVLALVVFIINANQTIALQDEIASVRDEETIAKAPKQDAVISRALDYYYEKTGDEVSDEITAEKKNFGCHTEIYVYKNAQLEMRLSYAGGRIYEL